MNCEKSIDYFSPEWILTETLMDRRFDFVIVNPKIVSIGSGSASFYLSTLGDIFTQESLKNAELYLIDINKELLTKVTALANILKTRLKSKIEITSSTDRTLLLSNADFVILTLAVDREQTWKEDIQIAQKYGIWHYGENGGPGAFGHTARNVATLLPILQDINDLAPNATIINFTNPLPRIHLAITSLTGQRCISYCHQYFHGYYLLGKILMDDLLQHGHSFPNQNYHTIRQESFNEYDVKAAGINHFTWMLTITRMDSGEDIYPILKAHLHKTPKNIEKFEKLSRKMFEVFGYFPVPGETHLSEYLPYTKTKENWRDYNLFHFNFEEAKKDRVRNLGILDNIVTGKGSIENLNFDDAERLAVIIGKLCTDKESSEPALNTENRGTISNLPEDCIIEVPCQLSSNNVTPYKIGKLPDSIAALCHREIIIAKLMVEGSIQGSRDLIVQAFALDPMVADLKLAEQLTNDYISTFHDYLPQFYIP